MCGYVPKMVDEMSGGKKTVLSRFVAFEVSNELYSIDILYMMIVSFTLCISNFGTFNMRYIARWEDYGASIDLKHYEPVPHACIMHMYTPYRVTEGRFLCLLLHLSI